MLTLVLAIAGMALSEEPLNSSDITVTIRGLIYTCVRFYYFKRSDRVQATFGRNLEAQHSVFSGERQQPDGLRRLLNVRS